MAKPHVRGRPLLPALLSVPAQLQDDALRRAVANRWEVARPGALSHIEAAAIVASQEESAREARRAAGPKKTKNGGHDDDDVEDAGPCPGRVRHDNMLMLVHRIDELADYPRKLDEFAQGCWIAMDMLQALRR